jgi:hypothetical protein
MSAGFFGQLGYKAETAWGTAVTVDEFHPGWTSGNPVRDHPPLVSKGIRGGRRMASVIETGAKTVSGGVSFELYSSPMNVLLTQMYGTVNDAGGSITAWPAAIDQSLTMQFGIPDTAGTVIPFTYSGCRFPSWSISASAGEIATFEADVSAKDYVTGTALAAASYGTMTPFTFIDGSVSVAGSTLAEVKSFELAADRPMRVEHYLGGSLIAEQIESGQSSFTINVETEFLGTVVHNLANTEVAVVLTFNDGTDSLVTTCNAWVVGTTPNVSGVDSLSDFGFEAMCIGDTDAAAITSVLVNNEAS